MKTSKTNKKSFKIYRKESGELEPLEITSYSSPPDLPDVMKQQEAANGQELAA